jgi:hypothetical protein
MTDNLDIPEFLRRIDTEESRRARAKIMRDSNNADTRKVPKADRVKHQYDSTGHVLPRNMDDASWKLLRQIEGDAAREEKERKAEAFRLLKIRADEKRAAKKAAKAAQQQAQGEFR